MNDIIRKGNNKRRISSIDESIPVDHSSCLADQFIKSTKQSDLSAPTVQRENHQTKIFRCFEKSCEKLFSSPKTRRLHLIDFHRYPRTFFFSLPNQGLNDLYRKFGSGVSLVRPEWKASADPSSTPSKSSGGNSKVNIYDAPTPLIRDSRSALGSFGNDHQESHIDDKQEAMDSVIDSIQQLSLVPRQIQFGKKAGSKSFQR
ncbi:hypothetical protein PGTUg99_000729 [Puccinia graminis f. sp. tritici]|uniref:C2H2-type domain-containing protein n=1 Tax=Puccinia graminis f. sp. tritici TaxID=56615 RepID=A0A5B0QDZ2_PUCGR|nr:hypothetical protein PGTUg99_011766 [Puccinia graminis f. sp. tritici]KAA1136824.1 hypothetical protein PGTUg99_000729 [Puccinia graminis f. sp. tritici]